MGCHGVRPEQQQWNAVRPEQQQWNAIRPEITPFGQSSALMGADNVHFARGGGGPAGVSMYQCGEEVLVLASDGAWHHANVTAVHRDGTCDIRYIRHSGGIKQVPLADQPAKMKKA